MRTQLPGAMMIILILTACAVSGPTAPVPNLTPAPKPISTSPASPAPTTAQTTTATIPTSASVPAPWPTTDWPTSTPEQQGLDVAMLEKMVERINQDKLSVHSVLIVRHGYLVYETYFKGFQADTRHEVYSCTKSVISALIGIAIEQGYIDSLQHKVLDYFPDRQIAYNEARKQALTLEHLLTMTSGLDSDERMPYSQDWVQFMLDRPMVVEPGTKFSYSSGNTHLLAAVLRQATGIQPADFARTNLFDPLGISNLTWDTDPAGLSIGGWGIRMTPRDMAKFGYLYLHGGQWHGRQLVPADWVKLTTQKYIDTGDGRGYGYAWWQLPFGGYAALGYGGQQILVFPERDMVVVFTSQPEIEKQIWRLVDDFIIPAQLD